MVILHKGHVLYILNLSHNGKGRRKPKRLQSEVLLNKKGRKKVSQATFYFTQNSNRVT